MDREQLSAHSTRRFRDLAGPGPVKSQLRDGSIRRADELGTTRPVSVSVSVIDSLLFETAEIRWRHEHLFLIVLFIAP